MNEWLHRRAILHNRVRCSSQPVSPSFVHPHSLGKIASLLFVIRDIQNSLSLCIRRAHTTFKPAPSYFGPIIVMGLIQLHYGSSFEYPIQRKSAGTAWIPRPSGGEVRLETASSANEMTPPTVHTACHNILIHMHCAAAATRQLANMRRHRQATVTPPTQTDTFCHSQSLHQCSRNACIRFRPWKFFRTMNVVISRPIFAHIR